MKWVSRFKFSTNRMFQTILFEIMTYASGNMVYRSLPPIPIYVVSVVEASSKSLAASTNARTGGPGVAHALNFLQARILEQAILP